MLFCMVCYTDHTGECKNLGLPNIITEFPREFVPKAL